MHVQSHTPRRSVSLTLTLILASLFALTAGAAGASADSLHYYGGHVLHSSNGILVNWSTAVNPIYTDATTGDPGLIKARAAASATVNNVGGVLAQYMDVNNGTPANSANRITYGGEYTLTPSVTSTNIDDTQIQSELVAQIGAGRLPAPTGEGFNNVYMVNFPAGDKICIGSTTTTPQCSGVDFCAYHGSVELSPGTWVIYAVLPDNTSGGMAAGCGAANTSLQNQTSYLTHEWDEAITDPLVDQATSLSAPLSWYDNNCTSSNTSGCGEIGDKCNQQQTTNSGWTVQMEWSNLDNACVGVESAYSQPTAAFTAAPDAVAGQALSFSAAGSSDPAQNHTQAQISNGPATDPTVYSISSGLATYGWSWGDGTTAGDGVSATHVYASPGTYQVALTVTDNLGFSSVLTKSVTVSTPAAGTSAQLPGNAGTTGTTGTTGTPGTTSTTGSTGGGGASNPATGAPSGSTPGDTHPAPAVAPAPAAQAPTAVTAPAGAITATTAGLMGTLNPGGDAAVGYVFTYGTAAGSLDHATVPGTIPGGRSAHQVYAELRGLAPATKYYFRLQAILTGSIFPSPVQSFTTAPAAPSVSTGHAVAAPAGKVLLNAVVNPGGSPARWHFEFGNSTSYGLSSVPSVASGGPRNVAVTVAGLKPGAVYHFRVVAVNPGGTAVGADVAFRTPAASRKSVRMKVRVVRKGRRHVVIRVHCARACTAHAAVTRRLSGALRMVATPIALGQAKVHVAADGWATMVIDLPGNASTGTLRTWATTPDSAGTTPELQSLRLS